MNVDGTASHSCPNWAELSEAFDSGEEVSMELQKHLNQCPKCAGAWRTMIEVHAHLRSRAEDAMRAYNSEAIKQGVYRKLAQPRIIRFNKFQRIGSMAAMFFAGMFVFYLFTNDASDKVQPQFVNDGDVSQIASGSVATAGTDRETFLRNVVKEYPYYSVNESEQKIDPANPSTISLVNLENVDLNKTASPIFGPIRNDAANQEHAVSIADTVQHVWVVSDLKEGIQEVRDLLAQLDVTGDVTKETDSVCEMTVHLDKMQLVKFVRAMAADKGDLMSNVAPQPEQKLFAGVGSSMVTYHIKLLKN